MKRILVFISILICTFTTVVRAQYDAQLSQYFMAMSYYNPAIAGSTEDLNLLALHRQQWIGISGAPKSFFINAEMPVKFIGANHGIGVVLFNESIGLFNNMHISAQYAYKHKLFGGVLSVGVQFGLANQAFKGSEVELGTSNFHEQVDGSIPLEDVEGKAFDLNAGIYYKHKKFYAGIGVMHIMEPEISLSENAYTYIGRSYNFAAGYNIQTRNPLFQLQPSVFLKTDLLSFQADVTARVVYNNRFNGGVSWRVNESVVVLLGATFGRFNVGYAYDLPTTAILRGSTGSHELMISYRLRLNKLKTGNNRHKSVRIL